MRATNDNCRCVVCRVGHDMVTYLFDQNVVDESVRVLGLSRLVDRHFLSPIYSFVFTMMRAVETTALDIFRGRTKFQ